MLDAVLQGSDHRNWRAAGASTGFFLRGPWRTAAFGHERVMPLTRQEFVDQHNPEAARYLEELLGVKIERLSYDGSRARALTERGEVDCTDALHGWLEIKLREVEDEEDTLITSDVVTGTPTRA